MDDRKRMLDALLKQGYLRVVVKPGKKKTCVVGNSDGAFVIELDAPAREGKANEALVKFVSRFLKKQVRIKSGHSSKEKIIY